MVAIRLRRAGSKKRPFFRVVVTDSRAARDSCFVEILGHYNPRTKPAVVQVDKERVDFWIKKGAQPSDYGPHADRPSSDAALGGRAGGGRPRRSERRDRRPRGRRSDGAGADRSSRRGSRDRVAAQAA